MRKENGEEWSWGGMEGEKKGDSHAKQDVLKLFNMPVFDSNSNFLS